MVIWCAALLVWEQLILKLGGYSIWCYRLYATAEAAVWADQLLFRIFGRVSVPVVIPGLFTPYLYLLFGKKDASRTEEEVPAP